MDLRTGVRQEAAHLLHLLESATLEKDFVDPIVLRAEMFYSHLLRISHQGSAPGVVTTEITRNIVEVLQGAAEELHSDSHQLGYQSALLHTHQRGYQSALLHTHQRGRPRCDIPRDQLVYFIEHGFTCRQIGGMLGVSLSTIRHRMSEYGLSIRQTYSTMDDDGLCGLIKQAQSEFPNCGYRMTEGNADPGNQRSYCVKLTQLEAVAKILSWRKCNLGCV